MGVRPFCRVQQHLMNIIGSPFGSLSFGLKLKVKYNSVQKRLRLTTPSFG